MQTSVIKDLDSNREFSRIYILLISCVFADAFLSCIVGYIIRIVHVKLIIDNVALEERDEATFSLLLSDESKQREHLYFSTATVVVSSMSCTSER